MSALLHRVDDDPPANAVPELLGSIFNRYGIDFRGYALSSLKRRLQKQMEREALPSLASLQELVLGDSAAMGRLLCALTVHVTAMFRDPAFHRALVHEALPLLRTYPFARIWIAGCSTGEEVYSLAILLEEAGLYERCRIYATDVSSQVLDQARAGIYPLAQMQEYTRNYQQAGGLRSFAEYYSTDSESAVFRPSLKRNVFFAAHNLVSDNSFNEFQLILCRNVMIYFNRTLQERAHRLFYDSLQTFGYFALGRSENIRFTVHEADYETVSARERLYRKIR
jgi:chemotaxis protein methyltransferase CheR